MFSDFVLPIPRLIDDLFLGLALIMLIISWYYFFTYFNKFKISAIAPAQFQPPVSVVIAARNEINNLQKNIPHWLSQEYPNFELIIADDGSTDGTSTYIAELAESNPKIKLVLLDAQYVKMHGKKIALTLAFKKAQNDYFLLTDADCVPSSPHWISKMAGSFTATKQIVLGYSPYEKRPGLLNKIIRYETVLTAMQYLGFAAKGKAYMGVGRNLGYSRAVYNSHNGFASHAHILAGDDDLFVQENANQTNVATCTDPNSFCISVPKSSFAAWRTQKKRHLWVGKFYSPQAKTRLMWYPISQLFFVTCIFVGFSIGTWFVYPLLLLIIKWIPEWIIFGKQSKKLLSKDLSSLYPIFNLFHSFWYFFAALGAFFAKKPKW
jgi:glycosyltransferase involved in cell wall biosynthesis